jgi:TonB family protein
MAVMEPMIPRHRRLTASIFAVVVVLHVAIIAVLIWTLHHRPVRMASSGPTGTIAAYVPGPIGTAGKPSAPAPKKKASRVMRAEPAARPQPSDGAGESTGNAQAGGTGPVRLGAGGNLTLVHKVVPAYPRLMQSARIPGSVVLDAVIEPDGSIGDVRVLSSTNDQFAQAAVAAVKQWKYAPIGFEGIVTVTVNFTVPG